MLEEFGAHAGPLGALSGEDEDGASVAAGFAGGDGGGGGGGGQCVEAGEEGGAVGVDDDGAVFEGGAAPGQAGGDVEFVGAGVVAQMGGEPGGLGGEGGGGVGRQGQGEGGGPGAAGGSGVVGGSSMTTWALVPLTPKEEMPARRGLSPVVQVRAWSRRRTLPSVQSMWGEGVSAWRVRGRVAFRIAITILMTPATPAAAWVCPRLDLTDPSHSGVSSGRSWP
ncbi:hypothetical protein [Streptomyces sp. SID5473]|uniref:hypothetical protein n=1 Tax=Streptomyces sp. SID5473 TaxID=2690299 RepID=UPI0006989DDA|nr:hypothetical protein [Streptomyces sp. SID5473]